MLFVHEVRDFACFAPGIVARIVGRDHMDHRGAAENHEFETPESQGDNHENGRVRVAAGTLGDKRSDFVAYGAGRWQTRSGASVVLGNYRKKHLS